MICFRLLTYHAGSVLNHFCGCRSGRLHKVPPDEACGVRCREHLRRNVPRTARHARHLMRVCAPFPGRVKRCLLQGQWRLSYTTAQNYGAKDHNYH